MCTDIAQNRSSRLMFWDLNVVWDAKRAAAFAESALRLEGLAKVLASAEAQTGSCRSADTCICSRFGYAGCLLSSVTQCGALICKMAAPLLRVLKAWLTMSPSRDSKSLTCAPTSLPLRT